MTRGFLALAVALLVAGCGEQVALDRLPTVGRARVVEVVSGDAVVVEDGELVKLAGLVAPHRGEVLADEARAALADLVLGQEVELLSPGAARDRFGRPVAQVRIKHRWVQKEMLATGLARVRTFSESAALAEPMLAVEARARADKRGLWALADHRVLLPNEAMRAEGFAVVEGRVDAVRRYGRETVLKLGPLEASLPSRAAGDFAKAGKAPASLAGRLVRARGSLRGGVLRLDHPQALEVLDEAR